MATIGEGKRITSLGSIFLLIENECSERDGAATIRNLESLLPFSTFPPIEDGDNHGSKQDFREQERDQIAVLPKPGGSPLKSFRDPRRILRWINDVNIAGRHCFLLERDSLF